MSVKRDKRDKTGLIWFSNNISLIINKLIVSKRNQSFSSLEYSESESKSEPEPYGIRAVKRTHLIEDFRTKHLIIDPKKTTCMLYLQADHLFHQKMGSDEACIDAMTRHVQKVNSIYKNTGQSPNNSTTSSLNNPFKFTL